MTPARPTGPDTEALAKLLSELEASMKNESSVCEGCRGVPTGMVECCDGSDGCPCRGEPNIPWSCPQCNGSGVTPDAIRQNAPTLLALAKWALAAKEGYHNIRWCQHPMPDGLCNCDRVIAEDILSAFPKL